MEEAVTIAAVVEGEGEIAALPQVLRRRAVPHEVWDLQLPKPFRVPRGDLTKAGSSLPRPPSPGTAACRLDWPYRLTRRAHGTAKGWLSKHRADGRPYQPTADQAALAAVFGLDMARAHSPSFEKLCREVAALILGQAGQVR